MDILSIKGVEKRFGNKRVLQGLDLTVPEHSIFGFVGCNGSGKTTTMKTILGFLRTDGGDITVAGERVVYGNTPTNRFVGYLPDVPEFYGFMTAKEYLALCGESLSMNRADIRARSDEMLALVGLADETHRIKGYSRGMKQRLGIAQALLGRPKLLICDEPTSALDPIGRKEILDVLASVREQTTVLFSTHILSDVERICTDVALLHNGRIAVRGTVEALKKVRPAEEFLVETMDTAGKDALMAAFADARSGDDQPLFFSEARMYDVLGFVGEHRIPLRKIERIEPTLESLFLEVTGA